jgi:hypothetical protein
MGNRIKIATSQTAWEISPGQTERYLLKRAPQKKPQINAARKSIRLKAQI